MENLEYNLIMEGRPMRVLLLESGSITPWGQTQTNIAIGIVPWSAQGGLLNCEGCENQEWVADGAQESSSLESSKVRVNVHMGTKKNLQFESSLDKSFSVRISQNSSPKFLCKKDSKLKEVWKIEYTLFSVLKPDSAY